MRISITDTLMSSDETTHTARPSDEHPGQWTVSWLAGCTVDRNQAITAMTLAETIARGVTPNDRMWPHVVGWANELGLSAAYAVDRCQRTVGES